MKQAVADVVHAGISRFYLTLGWAGGGETYRDPDIDWTIGGSPYPYHNAVVRCTTTPGRADDVIRNFVARLDSQRLAGSWHLSPLMSPTDLPERLMTHGFERLEPEPLMALHLDTFQGPSSPTGLTVRKVAGPADLGAYCHVLATGFGDARKAEWLGRIFETLEGRRDTHIHHFVGLDEGTPCSTATTYISGTTVGVHFVSTMPSARRRGFASAVTANALNDAAAHGAATAVLTASHMAVSIYKTLGFVVLMPYTVFLRQRRDRGDSSARDD